MKVKHVYDLPRLKPGAQPKWHVICDGLVISTHRTHTAALRYAGKNPHHKVYRQDAPTPGYYNQDRWLSLSALFPGT